MYINFPQLVFYKVKAEMSNYLIRVESLQENITSFTHDFLIQYSYTTLNMEIDIISVIILLTHESVFPILISRKSKFLLIELNNVVTAA